MFRNEHLDDDEWTMAINWGDNDPKLPEFHMEDPSLLVLESEAAKIQSNTFCLVAATNITNIPV